MKKYFILFLMMTLLHFGVSAQSAYRGGAGDGYGMAEILMLPQLHVKEVQKATFSVFPNPAKAGSDVIVELPESGFDGGEICIWSVDGKKVFCHFVSPFSPKKFPLFVAVPVAGVYHVKFIHRENANVLKLIIID